MSQSQPTEQTYASDLKEFFGQIIQEQSLPFSSVKVEMIKDRKRADILIFDENNNCVFVIEVKRPEIADAPYDPKVIEQATQYAEKYKPYLRYFATHNVNFLVLWDSVTSRKVDQFAITYITQLDEYLRKTDEIKDSFRKFFKWYSKFLQGEPLRRIDDSIAEVLHNYIRGIVNTTDLVQNLIQNYIQDTLFRQNFEIWLADNGLEDPQGDRKKLEDYCIILAKQYTYIFVNKILFYNVLRERYPTLSSIVLPTKGLVSNSFYALLGTYFEIALQVSKDYETVFKTNFVDRIPLPNSTINELVKVIQYLQSLDFSVLGYDIIGKVFEKLIPQDERHALGQYFTRSDVVDLIVSFCVKDASDIVLDPSCGSGTFLIESYYRLKYLEGKKLHTVLLNQLWGIDIAKFPAHLSTVNLAIQDLSVEQNYPNIVYKDFFEIFPKMQVKIGVQNTLHDFGVPEKEPTVNVKGLDKLLMNRKLPLMTAVIGNPPYTRQEEMLEEVFGRNYKETLLEAVQTDFPGIRLSLRASIYVYFFIHGLRFLGEKGRLGFVTLRSWLDVSYGEELKNFFLSHCKIITVIESKEERWFPAAQMLPCITILENCGSKKARDNNLVRFVQLKKPLSDFVPPIVGERQMVQEIHRWKRSDEFVSEIENAEAKFTFKEIEFLGRRIKFFENDQFKIALLSQKDLRKDSKWGKYLVAPSAFFNLLDKSTQFVSPLEKIADIKYAIKTGANEFFCIPNRFFKIKENEKYIVLVDKGTKKERFQIEKEYVSPVLNKIKPHKSIGNLEKDGYLLTVHESKGTLKVQGKKVFEYIEYGEQKAHTWRNVHYSGYNERPTCASRTLWYSIEQRPKSAILSPSIFWGRHVVFHNNREFFATDCLDEIRPFEKKYSKALAAILNSTFEAIFYEFSGRYIENRDKTISNEIKIYELKKIPSIDPAIIEKRYPNMIHRLETALKSIETQEVKPLFEEINVPQRQILDEIVLCDILGLTKAEAEQISQSAGDLFRQRIERFTGKEIEINAVK